MRKYVVAGNWKMNTHLEDGVALAKAVAEKFSGNDKVEAVVCPPYLSITKVGEAIKGTAVKLGAQDCHFEDNGAYTGKVSVSMLKDAGVEYVILGHSEQRTYFHESNEGVNKKTKKVLEVGLTPIICVGETLEERESNNTEAVVEDHVRGAYAGLSAEDAEKTIIAYEPVWAIGTGKTATSAQAQEVHKFIRSLLAEMYSADLAEKVRIQYGGSMKPENAGELLAQPDVDGGLIGGAALKADSFIGIIEAA